MTWDELGEGARDLAERIHADGYEPDVILAVARGGLLVAAVLGYALGVKNTYTMNVEFYTGVDERLPAPMILPPVPELVDLAEAKLLIADEAMAGLSHAEVDDILAILFRLNERGITIIMIEHIMRAVMRFSERIVVLDAGERIAEGTPDEIVRNPDVEKAYLGE